MLSEFGARKETALAYLNAARGLGFLGGPMSGQLLYDLFKYFACFMIFAGVLTASMIFTWFMLPARLNQDNAKTTAMVRATARLTKMQKNVSYSVILKNKRAAFCLFTLIAAQFFAVEPFLSKELKRVGYPTWSTGLIFGAFAFMYTLMAFLVAPLAKKFSTKIVSLSSYIIIGTGCFIFGPISVINNSIMPAPVQIPVLNQDNTNQTITCEDYGT